MHDQINAKQIKIVITIAIVVASIALHSLNIAIIAASIYSVNSLLLSTINPTIFNTKIFKYILIIFSYVILLQCSVLIAWLIDKNFQLDIIPLLLLVVLALWRAYNYLMIGKRSPRYLQANNSAKLLNFRDIISILIALTIIGVVTLPPIIRCDEGQRFGCFLVSNTSNSSDDASHLSFINNHIQFNRGIIYKSDASGKIRANDFYPATWSSVNAIIIKTASPEISPGANTLLAYVVLKIFWLFVISYLITRVAFTAFTAFNKQRKQSDIPIIAMSLFLNFLFILPLSEEGAFSFMPQLISVLLFVPLLIQFGLQKDYRSSLMPVLLIGVGGCLAWLLALPALTLVSLVIAIILVKNNSSVKLKNIVLIVKDNAPILIILYAAIITQIFLMFNNHGAGSESFANGIIIPGGKVMRSDLFYIYILTGPIMCYLSANKSQIKQLRPTLLLIASLVTYCAFIFMAQNILTGSSSYYYYKILDVLIYAILPFCIACYAMILSKITNSKKRLSMIISALIFVLLSWQIIEFGSSGRLYYAAGNRAIPSNISKVIIKELTGRMSIKNYNKKEYTLLYAYPNISAQNKHATKLILSNKPRSDCADYMVSTIYSAPSIDYVLSSIDRYCKGYSINIVTNKASYDGFRKVITDSKLADRITLSVGF